MALLDSAPATVRPRPTRRTVAFALTTASLLVLIAGTELPTPLYVVYQSRFGFSDTTLTLVFAIYALVLIPALVVGGRIADRRGRLPVVVAGLVAAAAGALVIATAGSTAELLVGRAVQGVAVGLATGPATAALVELWSPGGRGSPALWATFAVAAGGASGPLVAGVLAEYAVWPLQTCFLLQVLVIVGLLTGLALVRAELGARPGQSERGARLPGVPPGIRLRLARVGLVVAVVWSVGGLYTAVVPTYAATLLATSDLALLGGFPFLMLAVAAVTQLALRRVAPARAQAAGLALVVAGLVALAVAFPTHSLGWLVGSAVADGVGLGLGFLGAQADLLACAPPGRRAEVSGAFNVCLYLGVSLPVIGVGVVADATSLAVAVTAFCAVIGTAAVLTVPVVLRSRS